MNKGPYIDQTIIVVLVMVSVGGDIAVINPDIVCLLCSKIRQCATNRI